MFTQIKEALKRRLNGANLAYVSMYLLMLAPPRAFGIKQRQNKIHGELATMPVFMVLSVEFVFRVAFILLLAAGVEILSGDEFYETYRLDVLFSIVVGLGGVHSLAYYSAFNWVSQYRDDLAAARFYRYARNACYAALPGFVCVIPILLWKWDQEQPPFDDGLALQTYLWTTIVMAILGAIEARVMTRKPLGVETHHRNALTNPCL